MEDDLPKSLALVVREAEPDPELVQWAAGELLGGREPAAIVSDLVAQGWAPREVEAGVELARVRTRRERGVITRDDVAGTLDARYRRSTTGMSAFYRAGGGPLGIVAFATGLRRALAAAKFLGRIRRQRHRLP